MQTFMPLPQYAQSLQCLDSARLGKQRVECKQLLERLKDQKKVYPWFHPALKMWQGQEAELAYYGLLACHEWVGRGYDDTMTEYFHENWRDISGINDSRENKEYEAAKPIWWSQNHMFNLCHQSNLVRKMPEHYRAFFTDVPDNYPYLWPRVIETRKTGEFGEFIWTFEHKFFLSGASIQRKEYLHLPLGCEFIAKTGEVVLSPGVTD